MVARPSCSGAGCGLSNVTDGYEALYVLLTIGAVVIAVGLIERLLGR